MNAHTTSQQISTTTNCKKSHKSKTSTFYEEYKSIRSDKDQHVIIHCSDQERKDMRIKLSSNKGRTTRDYSTCRRLLSGVALLPKPKEVATKQENILLVLHHFLLFTYGTQLLTSHIQLNSKFRQREFDKAYFHYPSFTTDLVGTNNKATVNTST